MNVLITMNAFRQRHEDGDERGTRSKRRAGGGRCMQADGRHTPPGWGRIRIGRGCKRLVHAAGVGHRVAMEGALRAATQDTGGNMTGRRSEPPLRAAAQAIARDAVHEAQELASSHMA